MPRLVDADKLIIDIVRKYGRSQSDAIFEIDKAPTVDAEPVVRCKDCKWQMTVYCPMLTWERKGDHYCYKGEMREDE